MPHRDRPAKYVSKSLFVLDTIISPKRGLSGGIVWEWFVWGDRSGGCLGNVWCMFLDVLGLFGGELFRAGGVEEGWRVVGGAAELL